MKVVRPVNNSWNLEIKTTKQSEYKNNIWKASSVFNLYEDVKIPEMKTTKQSEQRNNVWKARSAEHVSIKLYFLEPPSQNSIQMWIPLKSDKNSMNKWNYSI